MNCKPGDLAVIVVGPSRNTGLLVRVDRAWPMGRKSRRFKGFKFKTDKPAWVVISEGGPMHTDVYGTDVLMWTRPMADSSLRPIRNPGDDAADEIPLHQPMPETEPA